MNLPEARQSPIDLTVLVTCYNEEKYIVGSLEAVVSAAKEVGISYEIIVIDDCSKDGSVARVQEYLRQHPEYPIALHRNEVNRGFANNYVDGAFLGRGKYYHLACGDDSMPKEHLVAAYRLVGKADMIVPYQIQREVAGKSPSRKIISRVFTRLVNLLSGYHLKYYNGLPIQVRYNVMRWHPVSYGFGFQADIITMLLDQGVSYTQVYSQSIDRERQRIERPFRCGISSRCAIRSSRSFSAASVACSRERLAQTGGNQAPRVGGNISFCVPNTRPRMRHHAGDVQQRRLAAVEASFLLDEMPPGDEAGNSHLDDLFGVVPGMHRQLGHRAGGIDHFVQDPYSQRGEVHVHEPEVSVTKPHVRRAVHQRQGHGIRR